MNIEKVIASLWLLDTKDYANDCGCDICGKTVNDLRIENKISFNAQRLTVDHDHITGLIRGMLCVQCNGWMGIFDAWETVYQGGIIFNRHLDDRRRKKYRTWRTKYIDKILLYVTAPQYAPYRPYQRQYRRMRTGSCFSQKHCDHGPNRRCGQNGGRG